MGQDQGNRLRMLILNERDHLAGIRFLQKLKRHFLEAALETRQDFHSPFRAQRGFQDVFGELHAPLGDIAVGNHHLVKFLDNCLASLRGNGAQAG